MVNTSEGWKIKARAEWCVIREKSVLISVNREFSIIRGCLSKNHPLNLAQKIILTETLPTERLYQG